MSTASANTYMAQPAVKNNSFRKVSYLLKNWMPVVLVSLAILVVWEFVSRVFHLPEFVLPAPSSIFKVLVTQQERLLEASWVTTEEIFYGFVLSAITGILIALFIARFEKIGNAIYPLMVLFQNVPKIALAPLFILWFGYDLAPKVVLIVVMAFFPIALNMLVGLRAADANLITLMKTVGASKTEILLQVMLPNSLPYLMSGMKIAITLSVIGAIVGEFAGASAGLGYVIQFASTQMETALVFAALIQISLLGMAFYYALEIIENKFITWAPKS